METKKRTRTGITISLPRYAREYYEKVAEANGMRLTTYLRLTLLEGIETAKKLEELFTEVMNKRLKDEGKK